MESTLKKTKEREIAYFECMLFFEGVMRCRWETDNERRKICEFYRAKKVRDYMTVPKSSFKSSTSLMSKSRSSRSNSVWDRF